MPTARSQDCPKRFPSGWRGFIGEERIGFEVCGMLLRAAFNGPLGVGLKRRGLASGARCRRRPTTRTFTRNVGQSAEIYPMREKRALAVVNRPGLEQRGRE